MCNSHLLVCTNLPAHLLQLEIVLYCICMTHNYKRPATVRINLSALFKLQRKKTSDLHNKFSFMHNDHFCCRFLVISPSFLQLNHVDDTGHAFPHQLCISYW